MLPEAECSLLGIHGNSSVSAMKTVLSVPRGYGNRSVYKVIMATALSVPGSHSNISVKVKIAMTLLVPGSHGNSSVNAESQSQQQLCQCRVVIATLYEYLVVSAKAWNLI